MRRAGRLPCLDPSCSILTTRTLIKRFINHPCLLIQNNKKCQKQVVRLLRRPIEDRPRLPAVNFSNIVHPSLWGSSKKETIFESTYAVYNFGQFFSYLDMRYLLLPCISISTFVAGIQHVSKPSAPTTPGRQQGFHQITLRLDICKRRHINLTVRLSTKLSGNTKSHAVKKLTPRVSRRLEQL